MRKKNIGAVIASVAVSSVMALSLAGCGNSSTTSNDTVAATVGDTQIMESTITSYIQDDIRAASGYDEDYMFAMFLSYYGYTPETLREAVINMFVNEELVKQAAAERNITVSDADVDESVAEMKSQIESLSDAEDAWETALANAGITEEEYRESVSYSLTYQALENSFATSAEPTDDEILSVARDNVKYFDGMKRSSHILFDADDEATAQEVLDKLNSGELTWDDAVDTYSQDSTSALADDPGDVGWTVLNSFVTEYEDALDGLNKGEMSGLITSDYGIHIIKCTDVFSAPAALTSLDQLPDDLQTFFTSLANTDEVSSVFSSWLNAYRTTCDVVINDMPSGLVYDIDIDQVLEDYYASLETTDSTSTDTTTTDSTSTDTTTTDSTSTDTTTTTTDSTSTDTTTTDSSSTSTSDSSSGTTTTTTN